MIYLTLLLNLIGVIINNVYYNVFVKFIINIKNIIGFYLNLFFCS